MQNTGFNLGRVRNKKDLSGRRDKLWPEIDGMLFAVCPFNLFARPIKVLHPQTLSARPSLGMGSPAVIQVIRYGPICSLPLQEEPHKPGHLMALRMVPNEGNPIVLIRVLVNPRKRLL